MGPAGIAHCGEYPDAGRRYHPRDDRRVSCRHACRGEYVAIARYASKIYQTTFKVVSGVDKDVEFLANETSPPETP
jgi:hypothetical protein